MFDFLNVLGALGVLITFLMNIKSDKKGRQFSKQASSKVEIFLDQREVAFLSPSKICKNLNFSRDIQIFVNFAV